jgi:hypothetical protein
MTALISSLVGPVLSPVPRRDRKSRTGAVIRVQRDTSCGVGGFNNLVNGSFVFLSSQDLEDSALIDHSQCLKYWERDI